MRYESPDTERDSAGAPLRNTVGPVLFSVMLHGVVLGLFARAAFAPEAETKTPDERRNVRVALVMRSPLRAPESLPLPVEEIPQPAVVEEPEPATGLAESAEPAAANIASDSDLDDEETASTSTPSGGVWTQARIRAAIETTSGERRGTVRSTVTEAWVTDCILEQKEEGTRDCGQQQEERDYFTERTRAGQDAGVVAFANITRPQQQARLVEQFTQQNARLEGLMAEGAEVGALAVDRYVLNRDYILYLTGNGQAPTFAAMGNFSADVLAGPQLSLPGNILFSCKKNPCIYEFTGFKVERPNVEPEAGEFRVVPTLFGKRH